MIQNVPIKEIYATGNAHPIKATLGPGLTISALHVQSGMAISLGSTYAPVVDGKTALEPFMIMRPSQYIGVLERSYEPEAEISDAVILGSVKNYYHFVVAQLPALALLAGRPDPVRLATTPMLGTFDAWMPKLLTAFSRARPVELMPIKHHAAYSVRNVLFPTAQLPNVAAHICKHLLLPMFLHAAGVGDLMRELGPLKLFVVRRGATDARNLINHAEVQDWYVRRGYQPINPGEMTLDQQAITFARATHIVGLEGGAMTNIAFAVNAQKVLMWASPMVADEKFFPDIAQYYDYEFLQSFGIVETRGGAAYRDSNYTISLDSLHAQHATGGW
ncbi:MAG: glycosyltransferase family 61 protein [Rhodospirillaceae bacterium]|nr:glycosyltransferase family 61 protein [Rhodospirillaceae bacterium]